MAYSKTLAKKYATNRNKYKSSDHLMNPFLKKAGIKGKTILDFGCGDGPEAARFIEMKAKRVVGTDPSAEMIRLAKARKLSNSSFIKNNGKILPLKDNQFDLVYSRFVLHYIRDLTPQFVEINRVLKKGGYFLALFQTLTDNKKYLNKLVPLNLGKGKEVTRIKVYSKSTEEVREALREAGMKVVRFKEIKNTDSHIDSKYKDKPRLKNRTHILFAQKR